MQRGNDEASLTCRLGDASGSGRVLTQMTGRTGVTNGQGHTALASLTSVHIPCATRGCPPEKLRGPGPQSLQSHLDVQLSFLPEPDLLSSVPALGTPASAYCDKGLDRTEPIEGLVWKEHEGLLQAEIAQVKWQEQG